MTPDTSASIVISAEEPRGGRPSFCDSAVRSPYGFDALKCNVTVACGAVIPSNAEPEVDASMH